MADANMTQAELDALYNTASPTSFGFAATNTSQFIHDYYGCKVLKTQCTDLELAAMQWGSSALTLNIYKPYRETSFLQHTGASVTDVWGIGKAAPEYYNYAYNYLSGADNFTISEKSVTMKIFNNITGILGQQRASIFIIKMMAGKDVDYYSRLLGVQSSAAFFQGMRYMVQNYVMGGLTTTQPANLWLYGYQSPIFQLIAQGDFFAGNDKDLTNLISPVFTSQQFKVSSGDIKINTGATDPYQVGLVQ